MIGPPNDGKDYKWYISGTKKPIGGLYATYHLLGEPETTVELWADPRNPGCQFCDCDLFGMVK